MKRDKLDDVFSKLVRRLAGFRCERCGKQYEHNSAGLHCSHHFGRRHRSVRWDLQNAAALCYPCHKWFGENPLDSAPWLTEYLGGEEVVDQLRLKAWKVRKWTPEEKEAHYQDMKKRLSDLENQEAT